MVLPEFIKEISNAILTLSNMSKQLIVLLENINKLHRIKWLKAVNLYTNNRYKQKELYLSYLSIPMIASLLTRR